MGIAAGAMILVSKLLLVPQQYVKWRSALIILQGFGSSRNPTLNNFDGYWAIISPTLEVQVELFDRQGLRA